MSIFKLISKKAISTPASPQSFHPSIHHKIPGSAILLSQASVNVRQNSISHCWPHIVPGTSGTVSECLLKSILPSSFFTCNTPPPPPPPSQLWVHHLVLPTYFNKTVVTPFRSPLLRKKLLKWTPSPWFYHIFNSQQQSQFPNHSTSRIYLFIAITC